LIPKDVLANIVTHIGSGVATEVDAALGILLVLVANSVNDVRPFTVFIQGSTERRFYYILYAKP
jgi:hypothetical protein